MVERVQCSLHALELAAGAHTLKNLGCNQVSYGKRDTSKIGIE